MEPLKKPKIAAEVLEVEDLLGIERCNICNENLPKCWCWRNQTGAHAGSYWTSSATGASGRTGTTGKTYVNSTQTREQRAIARQFQNKLRSQFRGRR